MGVLALFVLYRKEEIPQVGKKSFFLSVFSKLCIVCLSA